MSLTPKIGTCKDCGQTLMIRSGRCYGCHTKRFRAYGQPKDGEKPSTPGRKPTGEAEVFKQVWEERPHNCETCGCTIGPDPIPTYFSHIIRKSKSEELRLEKDNILLECFKCHFTWDHGIMANKVKQKSFWRKMDYIKSKDTGLYSRMMDLVISVKK